MLHDIYFQLFSQYTKDTEKIHECWAEIEEKYTTAGRHYHTLSHLENLIAQLTAVKDDIEDWDTILFSVFYHDIVYDVQEKDNEEQSADIAGQRLLVLAVPAKQVDRCKEQIIATKSHESSDHTDTNLFTDADLSILGASWDQYEKYCQQVRAEYAIYPDAVYNPGRQKVLTHFLEMERLFKTDYFYNRYEQSARENISKELRRL